MFSVAEGILVATSYAGQPRFSIWSADLQEIYHLPIAGFAASPTSGRVPLTVTFVNETVGGSYTSSSWDFGDGTSSAQRDPTHTYVHWGTFTVTLTVAGPGGSDTVEKEALMTVSPILMYLPILTKP
jgi:PKD repeat protein